MTVSYFEWTQNLQSYRWTEEEVNAKLDRGEWGQAAGHAGHSPSNPLFIFFATQPHGAAMREATGLRYSQRGLHDGGKLCASGQARAAGDS